MHSVREAKITSPITTLASGTTTRVMPLAAIAGVACLVVGYVLSGFRLDWFLHAYLTNFCFFASIIIGALFFVLVQHLTRAGWSVTVRRIAEIIACCVAPLAILFLPILFFVLVGSSELYTWNAAPVEADLAHGGESIGWAAGDLAIYEIKATFLNRPWFAIRNIAYFVVWSIIAWTLYRRSLRQDETGDSGITLRMQAFSAPMTLLFVAAMVFASFDWEMSLAPMWFSTMFPVYFFAGAVLSSLATITLVALLLQRSGRVTDEITVEHYHDLAKLTFAFIFFWGYIAFSQFMLIWYANFPEETFWFKFRTEGGWLTISMILLFGHLFIPFLGLMARTVRRNKTFLLFSSIYLLVMHWVDHYWIVMPQLNAAIYPEYKTTVVPFPPLPELLCLVGMGAIFLASFCLIAGKRSLVPINDPRLHEALNYDNP